MANHKLTFSELAKPRPENFSILGLHSGLYDLPKASNRILLEQVTVCRAPTSLHVCVGLTKSCEIRNMIMVLEQI